MKKLVFIVFLFFACTAFSQNTDTLYILQTTDVHGNMLPYDYFRDQPADYGLAKIYTKVSEYRRQHKNVLLLDGGDLIQGTPLVYYFNKIETQVPHPMIQALNYMGYDAFAVGNHDIEQGLFVYQRAQNESKFPWLSANSVMPDLRTYFEPYTIIEKNGIRIGIIGLTTPGIPMWLDPALYPGITWTDMIGTARKYVKELRPQVDVLVGLFHAGFNEEYSAKQSDALGLPNENASGLIAKQIPEFDVVFAGHSHHRVPEPGTIKKAADADVLTINAGSWGRNLGVAQLIINSSKKKDKEIENTILEKSAWLESMADVQASPAILQLGDYYHKKTLQYIRTKIADLSDTLSTARSRFEDSPLVELINKAQMDVSGADISFAASFNDRLKLSPGPIQIKDIYGMYRYENFLYVAEMTGQQIKDFLEYSARYYVIQDGELAVNPEMRGYNYDMAEGVSYTINVHNAAGRRIENLVLSKSGKNLIMDHMYKVALNSYRATGGGGHMAAAGADKAKIVWKSNEEIRNILAEYIKKQGVIQPIADGNWKLVLQKD